MRSATRHLGIAVLLLVAAGGCSGNNATISGSDQGGQILITGDHPPIEANIGENGIEGPPTPTPGPIAPKIPIQTPVPTATPRP